MHSPSDTSRSDSSRSRGFRLSTSRFDTEARIAVTQAVDLARELGHREVGSDHLLLGLLANARGAAYATLTDHGLRLDAAREIVAERHVDPADRYATEVRATGDATAERASYHADREALRAIGIDLDQVRQAVQDNLGQDLTDGWASRPERGGPGGRGRGRGHRHHHRHDPEGHERREDRDGDEGYGRGEGRGRRGPRSRRGDGPRFSAELRELLRGVRRSARAHDDRERDDADRRPAGRPSSLTGTRLLVALTHSEDTVVRAVMAQATDLDGLRHDAETAANDAD